MDHIASVALLYCLLRRRQRRRRRVHSRNHDEERNITFEKLLEYLRSDENMFFNYFRMSIESFDNLLKRLDNSSLPKQNTIMRECISTKMKLAICLRYLASGCSMRDLHCSFKVGVSTIRGIIWDVCRTLWDVLRKQYLRAPTSEDEWMKVVQGFERKTNFPHCLGVIDGKHIRILKPADSGSMFLNNKDYFSIVLLAVVDSEYRFIYADIGAYGKDCDITVLRNCVLWRKIHDGSLHLPQPRPLSFTGESMPYVFVGDEGFEPHNNFLSPFGGTQLDEREKKFNCHLSRARTHVECAFGILEAKWKILHKAVDVSPDLMTEILKACLVLHNYVLEYDRQKCDEVESSVVGENVQSTHIRDLEVSSVRSAFADYFLSMEDSVPS